MKNFRSQNLNICACKLLIQFSLASFLVHSSKIKFPLLDAQIQRLAYVVFYIIFQARVAAIKIEDRVAHELGMFSTTH